MSHVWRSLRPPLTSLKAVGGAVEQSALGRVCRVIACVLAMSGASGYAASDKWSDAVVNLKTELQKRPDDIALTEKLAVALVYTKRREEAVRLLLRTLESEKAAGRKASRSALIRKLRIVSRTFIEDTTFQVFQNGVNALQKGDLTAAAALFGQALVREPDHVEILTRAGQVAFRLGDTDTAAERLRVARGLNPYEAEIAVDLGEALLKRGELNQGLAELRWARAAAPESLRCLYVLAKGLIQSGQTRDGVALLEEGLRRKFGEADRDTRDQIVLTWAAALLDSGLEDAQRERIKKELSSIAEEPEPPSDPILYRAGQDLSLVRMRSKSQGSAVREEASKLLKRVVADSNID